MFYLQNCDSPPIQYNFVCQVLQLCKELATENNKVAQTSLAQKPFSLEVALPTWKRRGYPGSGSGVDTLSVRFLLSCLRRL